MEIGKEEEETIVVEPVEDPVTAPEESPEKAEPEKVEPDKVPA